MTITTDDDVVERYHSLSEQSNVNTVQRYKCVRSFIFTFHYQDEVEKEMIRDRLLKLKPRHLIMGYEVAPTTGSKHIQGYISFRLNKTSWKVIDALTLIGRRTITESNPTGKACGYVDYVKFGARSAARYCKKDGDYIEMQFDDKGQLVSSSNGPGRSEVSVAEEVEDRPQKRSKLRECVDLLLSGKSISDVIEDGYGATFVQYCNGLGKIVEHNRTKLHRDKGVLGNAERTLASGMKRRAMYFPYVFWCYGSTGTGKSEFPTRFHKEDDIWRSGETSQYFNGYIGQDVAVLDDFRGSFCAFNYLLKLLDQYEFMVNVKYGACKWIPTYIYITSCTPPWEVYDGITENRNQLYRRLTYILHFQGNKVKDISGLIDRVNGCNINAYPNFCTEAFPEYEEGAHPVVHASVIDTDIVSVFEADDVLTLETLDDGFGVFETIEDIPVEEVNENDLMFEDFSI